MACTCTEDKYLVNPDGSETVYLGGPITGTLIGRNKVTCQECLDNQAAQEAERVKARGVCLRCGSNYLLVDGHACTDDQIRLMQIDKECGPRAVREFMLASGYKGFVKDGETLGTVEKAEAEAAVIRGRGRNE